MDLLLMAARRNNKMIYDVIPFFNEYDMLEMRMNILDPHVDFFVVGECNKTFQNGDKPFNFELNRNRFSKWSHKIIYNKYLDDVGTKWNNWDRDKHHKNAIINALQQFCKDDDIIISGDCDEIPALDRHNINEIYNPDGLVKMIQNFYYYYINYQKVERWQGSRICSYKMYRENNFDALRNMKTVGTCIDNGGWHWSFLTNVEGIKTKIKSWGHSEYNSAWVLDNIEVNVKNGEDIFGRWDSEFKKVEIDSSYPKYILDNLDKYSQFILK